MSRKRFSSPEESFEDRTMPEPNTGCLLWIGGENGRGYGRIQVEGRLEYAHRYAWERENGPIPEGKVIDHWYCHTPSCVNADHLRETTQALNVANRSSLRKDNSTGFRNVFLTPKGRFQVLVVKNRKDLYFGTYGTVEEAAEVAERARQMLFGEFAGKG